LTSNQIAFTLSILIILLTTLLSKKIIEDREKRSPFECGCVTMHFEGDYE